MKKLLFTIFLIFFFIMKSVYADDEILLICSNTKSYKYYFVINKSQSIAKVVDVSTKPVVGKLIKTENLYILHFPEISTKTVNRYETQVRINRYSGKMEHEVGTPPFNEYNERNRLIIGECSQSKNVKKF